MPVFSPSLKRYKPLYTFLNKYGFKKGQGLPYRLESKNNKIWLYLNSVSLGFARKDECSPYYKGDLKLWIPEVNDDITYETKVALMKKFLKSNIKIIMEYDENPSDALYNKIKNAWNSFDWDVSKATASAERKFKFKDGSVITASCAEEAKAKHKVMAKNILSDELKEIQKILENNGFKNIKIAKSKTVKLSDAIKREQEENPHRRYKKIDKDEILYKGGVLYLENALKKIKEGTIFADSFSNIPEEITFNVNIVKENKQQNGIVHQTIQDIITVPTTVKGVKDALKYLNIYK